MKFKDLIFGYKLKKGGSEGELVSLEDSKNFVTGLWFYRNDLGVDNVFQPVKCTEAPFVLDLADEKEQLLVDYKDFLCPNATSADALDMQKDIHTKFIFALDTCTAFYDYTLNDDCEATED